MSDPKSALVIFTKGSEEMETIITVDVLRRGGIKVTLAGLEGASPITCSRGVVLVPDKALIDVDAGSFDAVILPGGLDGADAFSASPVIGSILKKQEEAGKFIGAICAAPAALAAHGIGKGKKVTCHPVKEGVFKGSSYVYLNDKVVVDGKVITSRGPGTTFPFALKIVELLLGDTEKPKEIAAGMQL